MKKVKNYLEFRRNRKAARHEVVKFATYVFSVINGFIKHSSDAGEFVLRLVEKSRNVTDDELLKLVLSELAAAIGKSEGRLMEIITYMANLSDEDIQKILVHSVVESKN